MLNKLIVVISEKYTTVYSTKYYKTVELDWIASTKV